VDETALHNGAVQVSLSATSRPAADRTPAPAPGGPYGVVVRLELPDAGNRPPKPRPDAPTLDPHRLAHAVEDLIRAIDPTLAGARVQIEVTQDRSSPDRPKTDRPTALSPARPLPSGPLPIPENQLSENQPGDENQFELDLAGRTLSVDGRTVTLTRREFDLMAYLQDRRGIALGRRELMTAVWQTDYLIGDRTIDVHVRRLRVKLGRHAERLSTLRGYGYRLD
jgi:DNA-binding response OmpR family regulator